MGLALMAMAMGARADDDDPYDYPKRAAAFCENEIRPEQFGSPDYCGFVEDFFSDDDDWRASQSKEYNETLDGACWTCGTVWGGFGGALVPTPQTPATLDSGSGGSFKLFPLFLSLYCTGEVEINAVFRVFDYMEIYGLGGGGLDGNKTRCSLGQGERPAPIEEKVNCIVCRNSECPAMDVNTWYLDTQVISLGTACPPGAAINTIDNSSLEDTSPFMISMYADGGMVLNVTEFTATQLAVDSSETASRLEVATESDEGSAAASLESGFDPCFIHSDCESGIEWLANGLYGEGWYCKDGSSFFDCVSGNCDECRIAAGCGAEDATWNDMEEMWICSE